MRAQASSPSYLTEHDGPATPCAENVRIALYSHDTMGIGHMRRNLLLAHTFARPPWSATILLIAGGREASMFSIPPGADCLALPAVYKTINGQYQSRALDVPFAELIALRSQVISAALWAFEPDVLIVDKEPRGVAGELNPALETLRALGRTRCVLGLRDVLDDPVTVNREWSSAANEDAIREYYDAVWVYGDPAVYDPVREYCFGPAVARKVSYTGYLDSRSRGLSDVNRNGETLAGHELPPTPFVLCMVGGGQDGACLAEAFAWADLPPNTSGVIVTGPFMPPEVRQRLHHRERTHPSLRVLEFVTDPEPLLSQADRVIAMGGYNTVCEILSHKKPALIIPRVKPRREQLIRAERLSELGLLDVLCPDEVTPGALSAWLAREPDQPHPRTRIDLNGTRRLPGLLEALLADSPFSDRVQCLERTVQHVTT